MSSIEPIAAMPLDSAAPGGAGVPQPLPSAKGFWRRALRHRSFVAGGVLTLSVISAALLSLLWTPWPAYEIDMAHKLNPLSSAHWLGTDMLGRDIVSLLMVGAQTSIMVGIIAVGIGLLLGASFGLLAAARRGWVEELIMRLSDFTFAFPALLSLVWTPWSPYEIDIASKLRPPSAAHWLGTDSFGRDIVSLLLAGARSTILVGIIAVSIGLTFGVCLGLIASAKRGWTEEIIMRFSDFTFAFPAVLSAIMLAAVVGPGMVTSIIAIGIFQIPTLTRLTRGSANAIWAREFVLAARASGKGKFRITIEHVLPNVLPILIVQGTIQFALAILAEAALSYLGLGTQPPQPSWGRMLNDAQTLLFQSPMLAVYPGAAIAVAVLGLNLLGDGLRDLLDPRLARER